MSDTNDEGNILAVDFRVSVADKKGYAHLNGTEISVYDFSKRLKNVSGPHSALCYLTMLQDSENIAVITVEDRETFYELSGIRNFEGPVGTYRGMGELLIKKSDTEDKRFEMSGFVKSFSYVPKGRIIEELKLGRKDLKKPKVFKELVWMETDEHKAQLEKEQAEKDKKKGD